VCLATNPLLEIYHHPGSVARLGGLVRRGDCLVTCKVDRLEAAASRKTAKTRRFYAPSSPRIVLLRQEGNARSSEGVRIGRTHVLMRPDRLSRRGGSK